MPVHLRNVNGRQVRDKVMQVQLLNIGSGIDAYRVTYIDYLPGSKRGAFTRIQVNTRLYGYIVNTIALIPLVTGRTADRQPRRSVRRLELYGFCLVRPGNELAVIQVEPSAQPPFTV